MDALSSNIRVFAEPSSLANKRSLPEPSSAISISDNAPSDIAATAGKDKLESNLNLNKLPSDDDKNAQRKSADDVEGAVKNANHFLEQISRELRFERSETDGQIVVQVKDQKTGAVIRQFPSEEMLQISKDLEKMTGLLFKDSA